MPPSPALGAFAASTTAFSRYSTNTTGNAARFLVSAFLFSPLRATPLALGVNTWSNSMENR
eukprot:9764984-Heterocapsa_arctica.AAC.1